MAAEATTVLDAPRTMTIDSARLQLRTVQMHDLDAIMPILTDPNVMQWTSQGPISSREQGMQWLSARALGPDVFNFVIRSLADECIVGILGTYHWPEVGYLIRSDHAGKGFATEALKAFIPEYFNRVASSGQAGFGYDHLEAMTDVENIASQRVLQKCGFSKVAVHENDFENSSGMHSTAVFRVARPGIALADLGLSSLSSEDPSAPPEPPIQ